MTVRMSALGNVRLGSAVSPAVTAIVSKPTLVLADEPTANLDSQTAEHLMELFVELNAHHKTTFIIATHDERVMNYCRRQIRMLDGRIVGDDKREAA